MLLSEWTSPSLVYRPSGKDSFSVSHASQPTALLIEEGIYRVFFATRDEANQSRITFLDWSYKSKEVIRLHTQPVIELGKLGTFDEHGMMPSSVLMHKGNLYLFYTGWSTRKSVRYQNSIGVARSEDFGETFERVFEGPILGQDKKNPYFVGTACVFWNVAIEQFSCIFASCTEWIQDPLEGILEPRYLLKMKSSQDFLDWCGPEGIAIDYDSESVGGLVTASVVNASASGSGELTMFFAERDNFDYRNNPLAAYRIRSAISRDGHTWKLNDGHVELGSRTMGLDEQMRCYPNVHKLPDGRLMMFLNGNGFGSSGILFSEQSEI